ncbi:MAG TPA: stage 0 sporulation family protein [Ktedonobacteraceae bacterium]|jgi:cell fate regulator YaaT (PSP1 superfamily)|nr:stage 0 sporulation family protein [Ktedonobacteraceae bacterium]
MSLATKDLEKTIHIVGIRFRPAGRIYYFDPVGQMFNNGQYVIVETVRGVEAGRVVIAAKRVAESELSDPLKPVLRLASEDELRTMLSFKSKEKDALVRCHERIQYHQLPMKLVETEYTFDGSRLTFYFTAEERVDFRALVRDLAATFRTRIELRQIGARDQAKLQGGIGPCGKTLCCSSWITDFGIVSIKMAKEQGLPLNPTKISGVCGRLMCCLSYENENYIQAKRQMPQIGAFLNTPSGSGKVVAVNVPKNSVDVILESGVTIQVPVEEEQNTQSSSSCNSCGSGTNCSCSNGGPCTCGAKKSPSTTSAPASIPKGGCCVSCSLNKQNQAPKASK